MINKVSNTKVNEDEVALVSSKPELTYEEVFLGCIGKEWCEVVNDELNTTKANNVWRKVKHNECPDVCIVDGFLRRNKT